MKKELIKALKKLDIVHKETSLSRTGEKLEYYVDFKKVAGHPEILRETAKETAELIPDFATSLAAEGHGGVPLSVLVSQETGLPLSLVRHGKREHGTKKVIDGHLPTANDKVVIVDDVFRTGSSIRETVEVLGRETEAEVILAVVVVKRGEGDPGVPFKYLVDVEELYN